VVSDSRRRLFSAFVIIINSMIGITPGGVPSEKLDQLRRFSGASRGGGWYGRGETFEIDVGHGRASTTSLDLFRTGDSSPTDGVG